MRRTGFSSAAADLLIELLREALQVDLDGAQARDDLSQRLLLNVAVGDHQAPHAFRLAGVRDIARVLPEDDRLGVGERQEGRAGLLRRGGHPLRRGVDARDLFGTELRDLPVLAVLALHVAARGRHGEGQRSRPHVEERLLLDRIGMDGADARVDERLVLAVHVLANAAVSPLLIRHAALARAEAADHAPALLRIPVSGGEAGEARLALSGRSEVEDVLGDRGAGEMIAEGEAVDRAESGGARGGGTAAREKSPPGPRRFAHAVTSRKSIRPRSATPRPSRSAAAIQVGSRLSSARLGNPRRARSASIISHAIASVATGSTATRSAIRLECISWGSGGSAVALRLDRIDDGQAQLGTHGRMIQKIGKERIAPVRMVAVRIVDQAVEVLASRRDAGEIVVLADADVHENGRVIREDSREERSDGSMLENLGSVAASLEGVGAEAAEAAIFFPDGKSGPFQFARRAIEENDRGFRDPGRDDPRDDGIDEFGAGGQSRPGEAVELDGDAIAGLEDRGPRVAGLPTGDGREREIESRAVGTLPAIEDSGAHDSGAGECGGRSRGGLRGSLDWIVRPVAKASHSRGIADPHRRARVTGRKILAGARGT